MNVSKRIVIHFSGQLTEQPIVSRLAKEYNLDFNILKAQITPDEEGLLVLELRGEQTDFNKGVQYLTRTGLKIEPLSQDVKRNEERCTHCGACVTICPADAFVLDPETRKIGFVSEKCLVCGICITACPPRAMELHF